MKPPHPTRDELLAMAYVDQQLAPEERVAFEARLGSEPELAREVASLRGLDQLARESAPAEPIDLAWRRIDEAPAQRALIGAGWLFTFAGALGLLAIVIVSLADSAMPLWEKASLMAAFGGLSLVFLAILKRRIQSRPFDPYTRVKR